MNPAIQRDILWPLACKLTAGMPNAEKAMMALLANMSMEMLYGDNTIVGVRAVYMRMARNAYKRYDEAYEAEMHAEWQRCMESAEADAAADAEW